jgi:hypothetical protein
MNENDFQQKLGDLLGQIESLPADQQAAVRDLADQTRERHDKLRKTVKDLQDSLDYLRLSVKYLVFDLEATRRENAYLRKMLDQGNNPGGDATGNDEHESSD